MLFKMVMIAMVAYHLGKSNVNVDNFFEIIKALLRTNEEDS